MQITEPKYKHITFEKSRKNSYTANQRRIMTEMKKTALQNGWRDIYTGEKFSHKNPPTIEHIIPCSFKNTDKVKKLKENGFQLNGLDNIFPVGSKGNSGRKSEPFLQTVLKIPDILKRMFIKMEKYKRHNSGPINGKNWVECLMETLTSELKGLGSDLKTKKLIIC